MSTVNELKEELEFSRDWIMLLDVMKSVAIFQFHSLQKEIERFDRFIQALNPFFEMLDLGVLNHPFIYPTVDRLGILMITSDEGFMGGLNNRVINTALMRDGSSKAELIIVGERGAVSLKEMDREFTEFKVSGQEGRYKTAVEIKDFIVTQVKEGKFGRLLVFYPRPVSFMVQNVEMMELLPVVPDVKKEDSISSVIVETPVEGILEYLVEAMLVLRFIEVIADGKLSEFAARAIHLERSGDELTEQERLIRFRYSRAYHGLIDKSIRELYSAQIIIRKR